MTLLVKYLVRIWWKKDGEFAEAQHSFYTLEDAEKKVKHLQKLGYGNEKSEIKIFKLYGRELIKTYSTTGQP